MFLNKAQCLVQDKVTRSKLMPNHNVAFKLGAVVVFLKITKMAEHARMSKGW